ncbi:hypothetical protein BE04_35970 [Sorangium cellulosum]|uniref:Uncharacterized protein n=2 Tax=Sorangium cellulosum TaxID=56 RepID=A0A150P4U5_SORCE|nr:hypothetical protein [Sorangium cellulosum]AGP40391.1 hypothetical protein SCE1572_41350 [Sorangium cellulosum So0157-2]KYF50734.1 hypothetical protein BE04_35970 [Sorangium cellulosum]
MQAAAKIQITIPVDRRVELKLPEDLPVGPAEVIVLVSLPNAPADPLAGEEGLLDAEAEMALDQDGRFRTDGGLVVFEAKLAPELQDELDPQKR